MVARSDVRPVLRLGGGGGRSASLGQAGIVAYRWASPLRFGGLGPLLVEPRLGGQCIARRRDRSALDIVRCSRRRRGDSVLFELRTGAGGVGSSVSTWASGIAEIHEAF